MSLECPLCGRETAMLAISLEEISIEEWDPGAVDLCRDRGECYCIYVHLGGDR